MNSAKLLQSLWAATTKAEILQIMSRVPHSLKPIAGRANNSGPIELATNPYDAITEGVTNAHDAVIMDYVQQGLFPTTPQNVIEALSYIASQNDNHPLVHIYHQKQGMEDPIITICDEGCGMTEEIMIKGVLDIGSPNKTTDPLQHGNYGQGGATLFGQSEASLIVTRTRNSNTYRFAIVYKEENDNENEIDNYVYTCHKNGLFTVDADDLIFQTPGKGDHSANFKRTMILPLHGTVRRNYGMRKVQYYGTHRTSIYTSVADRLFGSPGVVRLIGDDNDRRMNRRRGRRHEFDAMQVGDKFKSGAVMLYKKPTSTIRLTEGHGKPPIGDFPVSVWVISNWGQGQTDAKGKPKPVKTPLMDMLDGDDRGTTPYGLLVTLNGQTHARLRSSIIMRNAGLSPITLNVIMEVRLDLLPRKVRRYVISSDRTRLNENVQDLLEKELIDLLKEDSELQRLAGEMDSTPKDASATKDIQKLVNEMLREQIFGVLNGFDAQAPKTKAGNGTQLNNGSEVAGEHNPEAKPPFVPSDPPTYLMIAKQRVKIDRTEWVTICTDAPNHYGDQITFRLPSFISMIPGSELKLINGRMTFPVMVEPGTEIGTIGTMVASLGSLHAERDLTVVPMVEKVKVEKEKPKLQNEEAAKDHQQNTLPDVEIRDIAGASDQQYPNYFYDLEEEDGSFNFSLQPATSKLTVYSNTKFGVIDQMENVFRQRYRTEADAIMLDYRHQLTCAYVAMSTLLSRNEAFKNCGDGDVPRILSDMAKSASALIAQRYNDRDIRRALVMKSRAITD